MEKSEKEEQIVNLVWGTLLIFMAFFLIYTPVYTFVKGMVIERGGSIVLAIAVAWGLIAGALSSGILILKQA